MVIFHKNFDLLNQYNLALKAKEAMGIAIPENLKEYESFKGRVDFSNFIELFNFEKNIYNDKQFKYSLISNYNKRLIPEFISAALSKLIFDVNIDIDIRAKLEQYLIAIMSNIDYRNYATLEQLKNQLDFNKSDNTFYHILGSCPKSFKIHKFQILQERINTAVKFYTEIPHLTEKVKIKIYINGKAEEILYNTLLKNNINHPSIDLEIKDNEPTSKLTKNEISYIFNQIKDNPKGNNYNLILFASTYHITKVAQEIEKYFYEKTSVAYPKNIFIIGTEKFFDLVTNRKILELKERESGIKFDELFVLKKMQSFLFEIFMHSLDLNRQK
jgi:hypothetical protein